MFFVRAKDAAGARQGGCAGQGLAAGRAMRTRVGKTLGLQGKTTARSPIILRISRMKNMYGASEFMYGS